MPPGVPVVRMVEESLTAGMVEYVLFHVLRFHRFMPRYERDQNADAKGRLLNGFSNAYEIDEVPDELKGTVDTYGNVIIERRV